MGARPSPPARRAVVAAGLLAAAAGCGALGRERHRLRVMVPTAAGGGYDFTARTLAVVLRETELAPDIEVFNLTGGAGAAALSRLVHESGNERLLLQMGLGLLGGARATGAAVSVGDATPLARLIDEPEAVVVAAGSPYPAFGALVDDWLSGGLATGVGSHVGGPDHLALMLIAEAVGLAPRALPHERFDGGGDLLAALLGGRVDFVVSGLSEYRHAIEAGELRVLAVTGPERSPGIDAPTLQEAGLDVEFTNWRGLLAPPGLATDARERLVTLLTRLHGTPEWRGARRDNGWPDAFLTGDRFARFLDEETRRVNDLCRRFLGK
ncbi:tripartite tricarboxylate transporter substrate binding protein [Streptomyces radicis]|uniref:Tripartite tricarboxylate transporter substrate binding protein n=2 Tax=Streptomyces radicis TaxID=1750517 RepID=A0A3A9W915_9ACTN|nr:tripartite tricarboxylate transporter substrate binding protein [Streptomyces radicis]RKN22897.1 tripartite tricarboxylate transporter substrate binding protein [Streptomyces radicis]